MIIRKATIKDARRLCELGNQFLRLISKCSPVYQINKLNISKKIVHSWQKGIIKPEKNFYTFVAEDDGKILGYIELMIKQNEPKEYFKVKRYGWIDCIVVDEKIRGKGIGQKLFDYAIRFFNKKKLSFIRLNVFVKNELGVNFWRKNSFEEESFEMIRRSK